MSNSRHWLEIAEYALIVASILGAVVAVVSGQVIYVAVPISISLLLNAINRLRFEQQTRRRTTAAIIRLHEELSEEILSIEEKVIGLLPKGKQPILPYSQTAFESQLIASNQVKEAIAALQTQLATRLSQLEAIDLQPINKDIAIQRRLIASLQNQFASLEQSQNNAIENLSNSSLRAKVNELEKELAQILEAIASIQNQLDKAIQLPENDVEQKVATIQVSPPQSVEDLTPPTELPTHTQVHPSHQGGGGEHYSPSLAGVEGLGERLTEQHSQPFVKPQNWRCIHTFTAHSDWVRCLAINPQGDILVSGSFDKTIKLWHLPDGKLIDTLSQHSKGVFSVAITPDGQTLASGSWDETIKLWQLDTRKVICTLTDHSASVRSLAISPDGQTLVSGSFDRTIKLWSIAEQKSIGTLTENAGQVYAIALSPDGQTLASGGEDGIITLWSPDTCKQLGVLVGNSTDRLYRAFTVWSLAISPDGQILACGGGDDTIKLWHLARREPIGVLNGYSGQGTSIVITPDGQTLIAGSVDGSIELWDLHNRERLFTLTGDSSASVISVAISSQGNILASGSIDGTIAVWRSD